MSNNDDVRLNALVHKSSLPSTSVDNIYAPLRVGQYGALITKNESAAKLHVFADEGTYFTAANPTPGTGIIDTAALTTFSATTPTMVIYNGNATGGKSIYPVRFRVSVTAAGTSGTNWNTAWVLDNIQRWTSGGTALSAVNVNMAASSTTGAVIHFGAITAPAASSSARTVAQELGRTVIKVVGDVYTFEFGNSTPVSTGMPTEGTLQLHKTFQLPPVVIPPGSSLVWHEWAASQGTAAGFECFLEYVER